MGMHGFAVRQINGLYWVASENDSPRADMIMDFPNLRILSNEMLCPNTCQFIENLPLGNLFAGAVSNKQVAV